MELLLVLLLLLLLLLTLLLLHHMMVHCDRLAHFVHDGLLAGSCILLLLFYLVLQ